MNIQDCPCGKKYKEGDWIVFRKGKHWCLPCDKANEEKEQREREIEYAFHLLEKHGIKIPDFIPE
jgi:hypothetical protein